MPADKPMMVKKHTPRAALVALAAIFLSTPAPTPATAARGPHFEGAGANGSVVFSPTNEKLVPGDSDSRRDVYERSFDPNVGESGEYVTREVSTGPIGGNAAFDADYDGASADGSKI